MSARSLARPNRSRTTEEPPNSAHHAATGFLMLGLATFYFLALLSYEPVDLPGWFPLALHDTPSQDMHNFIGRFGAVLAGGTFWLLGAADYLIPLCLTWFGLRKLFGHTRINFRAWVGFGVGVICGAAILRLQSFWDWNNKTVTPYGAGGGVGFVVGNVLLVPIMGEVGSLLSLGVGYAIGMIFVTGMHPVQVLVETKDGLIGMVRRSFLRRKMRKLEAEQKAILGFAEPSPARAKRKKAAAEAGVDLDDADPPELPLILSTTPLPKIIDASAPKPPKSKPQLSEVWKQRNERKQERAAEAPPTSLAARFKDYTLPSMDLLAYPDVKNQAPADQSALREIQNTIIKTLATFEIVVTPGDITKGPAITRYEVYPSEGLRVSRIANLEADLARATKAERINILAPIPGKDTVGIELPNRDKIVVPIRELLEDEVFQSAESKIPLALGKDVYGKTVIADLAKMPHLLVAGATGSGKSVCINSIVTSLLCRFAPDELRFIMIDPKVVEMQGYKDLPHLALPVVTDPKLSLLALRWVVNEMEKRYQIFAEVGCRNFDTFNARSSRKTPSKVTSKPGQTVEEKPVSGGPNLNWTGNADPPVQKELPLEIPDTMPYIVVIVDELADLMQTAPADIEVAIARIAQKARAAGIHLILATQTPRADVVTGIIKANVPCRIAFQVASALDSRVILDRKGADKLVGKGDMLYLPPGTSQLIRAQGAMVTDDEIHGLVEHCCKGGGQVFEAVLQDTASEEEGEEWR